jgi:hypothetical protein
VLSASTKIDAGISKTNSRTFKHHGHLKFLEESSKPRWLPLNSFIENHSTFNNSIVIPARTYLVGGFNHLEKY